MSDTNAPERIWVDVTSQDVEGFFICEGEKRHCNADTEYIRADLTTPARVAELEAENARLREALTEIEGSAAPDHWVPQYQHCADVARAALNPTGEA